MPYFFSQFVKFATRGVDEVLRGIDSACGGVGILKGIRTGRSFLVSLFNAQLAGVKMWVWQGTQNWTQAYSLNSSQNKLGWQR